MSADLAFLAAAFVLGYLFGSIPFGLLLARAAGLGDVRTIGSGNIGATNVLRTGNKWIAAATLVGDLLKGTAAVLLANYLFGADAALAAALGAFLGHIFPVWLGFKGGKGVATYIGVALGLAWPAALVFVVFWLVTALLFRRSSLAGLVASFTTPFAMFAFHGTRAALLFVLLTVILWIKHTANIERLMAGTEPKIGASA
ncbi:MAG TPA: glycerol-3-phosphate 1-O-acyltransferase PlsY [Xanthobacteraceae bacterium]|nr:glycerol-3-phosphate 1-O-acyltransferase PlsY [Xanthobacteraceae bacterium]